jgi:hypothetical protein
MLGPHSYADAVLGAVIVGPVLIVYGEPAVVPVTVDLELDGAEDDDDRPMIF